MRSEDWVKSAAFQWRAVADNAPLIYKGEPDYDYMRGLADGYAGALEMVLREEQ